MCRLCQIETIHDAGETVPESLLEAHFAARDSVVGRWVTAGAADFIARHLADVEEAEGITTSPETVR